jgi:hypothetical protein
VIYSNGKDAIVNRVLLFEDECFLLILRSRLTLVLASIFNKKKKNTVQSLVTSETETLVLKQNVPSWVFV